MKYLVRLYEEFRIKNPDSNLNFVEWRKTISIPSHDITDDFQIGPDGAFYSGEFYPEDEVDLKPKHKYIDSGDSDDPDDV